MANKTQLENEVHTSSDYILNTATDFSSIFSDTSYLKQNFLSYLKSKNGNYRYKRYLGSPLRYAGGKSLAVGEIVQYIPTDIKKVISPFIGGGSVEIAIAKELKIDVIGYDIFELLVKYWQCQIKTPIELYKSLKALENTKEEYARIKEILKNIWNKKEGYLPNNLSDLELATYYYFNHNLSYGPGFLGWMSSIYTERQRYISMIEKVRDFYVPNLKVFHSSYEEVLHKHKNDFLYLDPPYFLDGNSKMFKGIYPMRNFPVHHNGFKHDLLANLLKQHKGGFVLSYNDCSWVREAYGDCEIIDVSWQYTMGQGETRIGKNRLERDYDNKNIKTSHELIIRRLAK
ncbi:MAG: DNA adenine methylase [Candidatus Cloacimonetes bacterium]|nr:DNA adenine methylase [Candidatus Cloacimonadota bacterium]